MKKLMALLCVALTVYMNRNILLRTVDINSTKEKHTRPDVPLVEFGYGFDLSKSKSFGDDQAGVVLLLLTLKQKLDFLFILMEKGLNILYP